MSYFHEAPMHAEHRQAADVSNELDKAKQLFETFAGRGAQVAGRRRVDRVIPEVLVDLGALRGLIYTRDHGGPKRTYIHFMDDPPRLMCDSDGSRMFVIGGTYRITRRGIEG
jgi:hypothetical protein